MRRSSRRWAHCALAASIVTLASTGVAGQEPGAPDRSPKDKEGRPAERASGVIIKVEPIARGSSSASSAEKGNPARREETQAFRLTINTAAVWSDWARDQVVNGTAETTKKAARRGADSVATRGEPVSKDTVVMIHLNPSSKVETRFRTLADETSKGSKTPEEARRQDAVEAHGADAGTKSKSSDSKTQVAKPVRFRASDLRPGLYVEVDFRHIQAGNVASTVAVIRPVGAAATSPGGGTK